MKPKAKTPDKDFRKDQKALAQIPAKTKELLTLQDQAEKSTGQEKIDLEKIAREKSP